MIYFLILLNITLLVLGQTLWKTGLNRGGEILNFSKLLELFLNPWIVGGIIIYIIATALWLYILSKDDLSRVYPLQSLSYLLSLAASIFFLQEKIPPTRWTGVVFIIIGAYFVSLK